MVQAPNRLKQINTKIAFKISLGLEDNLGRLSPDTIDKLYDKLHEVLCKSIIELLQDSIAGPGISKQQIETAREFAEVMPDTKAAKEVLEFLDSEKVQTTLIRGTEEEATDEPDI